MSGGTGGRTNGTSGGRTAAGSGGDQGGDTGSGGNDAGSAGDAAGAGSGGVAPQGLLELSITEPPDGEVIIDEGSGSQLLEVACSVEDPAGVGIQSVAIQVLDADDSDAVVRTEPNPDFDGEAYSVEMPINGLTGNEDKDVSRAKLRCSAKDREQVTTSAESLVYIDRGPLVTFAARESDAVPLSTPVNFLFNVEPLQLLPGGDPEAAVEAVTFAAGGVVATNIMQNGQAWLAVVDFADRRLYSTPPQGSIDVVVQATNRRGAQRRATSTITIDGQGPQIEVTNPKQEGGKPTIIGTQQDIDFTVMDSSGVKDVAVRVGASLFYYAENDPRWVKLASGKYTFRLSRSDVTDVRSQLVVSAWAKDNAGNEASSEAIPLYLDYQPPYVSLDPPAIRILERHLDGRLDCSIAFDPLGPGAASDGDIVFDHARFRALAWDRTNVADGQNYLVYSGVDETKVELFFQEPGKPLVVDTDHDGQCDDVAADAKRVVALDPIAPMGDYAPYRSEEPDGPSIAPSVVDWGCQSPAITPVALCSGTSDMRYVPRFPLPPTEATKPVVFGFNVADGATNLLCTGNTLEVVKFLNKGWACLAARAEDGVGNRSVSAPISVCYADKTDPSPCAAQPRPCALNLACTPNAMREVERRIQYTVP